VNVGHLEPQSTGKWVVGKTSTAKSEQDGRCDRANVGYKQMRHRTRTSASTNPSGEGVDYSLVIEGRDDG
jgi:hypothetical protein